MDLNEIKNRAKDLLADLTEPRPERDDRRDQDRTEDADRRLGERAGDADRPLDERAGDPAARTDRLDNPVAPTHASSETYPTTEPRTATEPVVRPTEGGHVGQDRSDFPEPARWDPRAPIADGVDEQPGPSDTAGREREHADTGLFDDTTADGSDRVRADTAPIGATRADAAPAGLAHTDAGSSTAMTDLDQPVEQGRHQYREPEYREPDYREAGHGEAGHGEGGYSEADRREFAGGSTHGSGGTLAAAAPVAGAAAVAEPVSPSAGARSFDEPTGAATATAASSAESGTPERLVTAERAQSYSSRWDDVKGEFVDEPRQAVAKADALVGELLDELGQLFDRQRRGIEHDFENDDVSTEELRVALRRYRSFFDRLLSV